MCGTAAACLPETSLSSRLVAVWKVVTVSQCAGAKVNSQEPGKFSQLL